MMIQEAWQKENRFPINMAIAIQQRFRRLGLHIFRTPSKMTFVSSVRLHPIDPAQTTELVRNILEWIRNNSGKNRQKLVAALAPGMSSDSASVSEIINSLVWLIDRGHVIEFMNGSLSVPNCVHSSSREARPGARKPSGAGSQASSDAKPDIKNNNRSTPTIERKQDA
jgi:hypothetical protein